MDHRPDIELSELARICEVHLGRDSILLHEKQLVVDDSARISTVSNEGEIVGKLDLFSERILLDYVADLSEFLQLP